MSNPDLPPVPPVAAPHQEHKRRHRCMRCNEEFDCPHGPNCAANYEVLPSIVTADGLSTTEHCPKNPDWGWIRAYAERRARAVSAPAAVAAPLSEQELPPAEHAHSIRELGFESVACENCGARLIVNSHEALRDLLAAERATVQQQAEGIANLQVIAQQFSESSRLLTSANAELTAAHNSLLVDGARWQTRAEQAEAALDAERAKVQDAQLKIREALSWRDEWQAKFDAERALRQQVLAMKPMPGTSEIIKGWNECLSEVHALAAARGPARPQHEEEQK